MLKWIQLAVSAACLVTGIVFMVLSVFGVNRFHKALNRMHAAAMGDTLGILFVFAGLIVMRGCSMDSLKLLLVILFFWSAGPVSGHMISRLEAMTDEDLGKILVIHKKEAVRSCGGEPVSEGEEKTDRAQEIETGAEVGRGAEAGPGAGNGEGGDAK